MLSVIVLCHPTRRQSGIAAEAIVRTLSALVAASVRGLVRDAVLAGPENADLRLIADHAGCLCVEEANEATCLQRALALVRAERVLILRSGYVPEAGFVEEAEDLLAGGTLRKAYVLRASPAGYWQRLLPALSPVVGILASVEACRAGKDGAPLPFSGLTAGKGRPVTLRSHARRVG